MHGQQNIKLKEWSKTNLILMHSKRKHNEESLSLLKWKRGCVSKYWNVSKPMLFENVPTSSLLFDISKAVRRTVNFIGYINSNLL
jgi:hypothetical protein